MISSTTKVKKTARAFRIWIEGNKLNHAGFYPGTKYDLEYTEKGIRLTACKDGNKTVSSCNRDGKSRPIIDLHSQEIGKHFNAGDQLEVVYFPDLIIDFNLK